MVNNQQSILPADEGMRKVLDMVKSMYVAELMEGKDSCNRALLSSGISHIERNGKPYEFSSRQVEELQGIVLRIGEALMQVEVRQQPQSAEESPLCYGDDMVSKFKVLGKVIKMPYLTEDVMGKTEKWRKMHLSQKDSPYYNQFSDAELEMINEGIHTIGMQLKGIRLKGS